MDWSKDKNVLVVEGGNAVNFDFSVKGINGNGDKSVFLTVVLDSPEEAVEVANCYYVSKSDATVTGKRIISHLRPSRVVDIKNLAGRQPCMSNWAKQNSVLVINASARVSFEFPIGAVFETCGILIALLDVPPKTTMTENVFGVSRAGEVLWQIERSQRAGTDSSNRYLEVEDSTAPGICTVRNWACTTVFIDVLTGRIVDSLFTK